MIAEVIINSTVKNLNRIFDYQIPVFMEESVQIGSRIFVPFGNMKRLEEGFVIGIKNFSEFKVKEIAKVEDRIYLSKEKIELAKWMEKRYFCNLSDCLKLMLPPGTTTKNFENRMREKTVNFVYLKKESEEIEFEIEKHILKSDKQMRALNFLIENGETAVVDLEMFADVSRAILKTLEKNGYIEINEKEIDRNPFIHKVIEKNSKLLLTQEQQEAYRQIEEMMEDQFYSEFLLFGVTGSGKTEVYLQLIEKALKEGKDSIMLVPEISLTPQTVDRFIARFGEENIAVLHSKLSVGERYDQWNKIERGEAKIVIGARSAIFAPVQNLGLLIIDEEHDGSYKSEMAPRYHAREIARYIAKQQNIPLLLGSATPDLDTYYRTQVGKITKLELTKRANESSLPQVEIVDLRQELAKGNRSMLSDSLHCAIEENIKNKRQTILFLNRRGFSTFIMCRDCGYTAKCKNCDITLTYHRKEDLLKCHYCGYQEKPLGICPECQSKNIRYFGTGTQKLEEEIQKIFPNATTIRMDIDTVNKKNSHEEILTRFQKENIDILIGTQMVVKGHHFPNVTLVGVVAADSSLNMDDYRASERTFQILTQVAGRAGREKILGKVIIQTYNPDHFSIEFASKQNYPLFYQTESNIRKQLKYPPFCDIIVLGMSSENKKELENVSNGIYEYLKTRIVRENLDIMLYKPTPAPIDRIKNKMRYRLIVKCQFNEKIQEIMQDCMKEVSEMKANKTRVIIDLNPTNMM